MIKFQVHTLVLTRVLSQCTMKDTLPTDMPLTDMEEAMVDTPAMPWEVASVDMMHI